ncbi:MAG TPA: hypothetical protein VE641_07665, partial [Chthoniobacterales bacterium]|nr:hypothetical protein [Chthoniobacterales bacterium]
MKTQSTNSGSSQTTDFAQRVAANSEINLSRETRMQEVFHGLVLADGRTFTNWGLSRSTRPAAYLEPVSYADVQAAVRDGQRFPSP